MSLPILYVEDEENDAFFMRRAFQQAGIQNPLRVVEDGRQAVDYLKGAGSFADRAQSPPPCLVLLDLRLPQLPGLGVLRWIREQPHFKFMPVVVLTSSREDPDVRQAYELGANAYLVKPPDAPQLMEMMKALKDFWLTHNQALPIQVTGS